MRSNLIIMHTHWDREWYFTKEETKVMLVPHMISLFDFLEANEDVVYILDGQSVMIDDLLELAPELEGKLIKYVEKGQLKIGPWYTQTDLMLVSGESIIRNLKAGINLAKEYCDPMLVGYAPDTFGHNAQMPQIYKGFGIESTAFWRGFSELKANKSDFKWEGIDGSYVIGINLATGYQGAKYLETDKEELEVRLNKLNNVLDHFCATNSHIIMNGHDQMPVQLSIKDVIKTASEIFSEDEFKISTFEDYVDELKKVELESVSGEFVHSKHARIHKTINSTRMDIKLLCYEVEHLLYNVLEPLSVYANQFDYHLPSKLIPNVEKELFGVHAHDSIGGCNSDKVNADILARLNVCFELINNQIKYIMRHITEFLCNEEQIVVINTLPVKRKEVIVAEFYSLYPDFAIFDNGIELNYTLIEQNEVDAGLIDRQIAARQKNIDVYKNKVALVVEIDAFSNKLFDVKESLKKEDSVTTANKNSLTFNIGDRRVEFYIETSIDDGDSYDYSPPVNDEVLGEQDWHVENKKFIESDAINYYLLSISSKNENVKSSFDVEVYEDKVNSKISGNIQVTNKDQDRRFRLAIKSVNVDTVKCGMQLCEQERKIYNDAELAIWETDKWAEKPVSIETMHDYISCGDIAVVSRNFKEYEVVHNTLFLTLYRSFGQLGKSNLVNRPGRPSGIEIATPDNQLMDKKMSFSFSIHTEIDNKILNEEQFPLIVAKKEKYNSFNINTIISSFSKQEIELDLSKVRLSCLKLDSNNNVFARIFNTTGSNVEVNLSNNCANSNFMEEELAALNTLEMKNQQICNIILKNID